MQCLMSNLAAVLLPWLLLVQQLPPQVASRGSSPGGIEVSKAWPHSAEQDSWLFVDDDEVQKADLTLVDTLVTTEDAMDHAYWYARVLGVQLSARELACARNGTVRLADAQGGGCAWLLEQGPCAPSEWLVLQEGAAPVCARRPCAPGYGLLAGEARCAPTHQLCAGDRHLAFRYSLRGEGRCHCKGFRALGPDGQCHVLFMQGACPDGKVLVPALRRSAGACVATCERAACADGEVRTQPHASAHAHAPASAPDPAPRCEEFAQLHCASRLEPLFTPDIDVQVPVCEISQRTLFATPRLAPRRRPERCLHDAAGRCLEVVVLAPEPFAWRAVGDQRIAPTTTATAVASAATVTASSFLSALLPLIFPK